jgi:hypothetical protein
MKTSAFEQWCARHEIPTATRDFLAHLRASPPARRVQVSFIRIKTLFLRKRATRPRAFSGWAFSHHVA